MVLGMQGASLGDQEAAHTGDFIKEGSTESQQLALSHAPMSSPSEPVLAGKSPAAMHLLHSCTHEAGPSLFSVTWHARPETCNIKPAVPNTASHVQYSVCSTGHMMIQYSMCSTGHVILCNVAYT